MKRSFNFNIILIILGGIIATSFLGKIIGNIKTNWQTRKAQKQVSTPTVGFVMNENHDEEIEKKARELMEQRLLELENAKTNEESN